MRSQPFLDIIAGLRSLDVDERARAAFRRLLFNVGRQHGIKSIERDEQLAHIRRLLAQRVSRPTIRDRMSALYGITPRHANRLIEQALQLGQQSTKNVLTTADN
jgi:hypothetical protein